MSSALIVNSTNAVATSPPYSQFQYNFPGNTSMDNKQLLPSTIVYPFSNFNFRSDTYQNTTFQIIWIDGTIATIILPNGYYSIANINQYLIEYMIAQTWYTINTAAGTFNYYLTMEENSTYYAVQLNSLAVPTAAEAAASGITLPTGATWSFPLVDTNPQFVIPAFTPNNYGTSFSASIGFTPATIPVAQTPGSNQSFLSNFTPQINPVTTVIMLCSLVNNVFAAQNQVCYAFNTGDISFGQYLTIQIPQEIWLNCSRGMFSSFTISFVDQTLRNPVPMQDPTITVSLALRDTPNVDRVQNEQIYRPISIVPPLVERINLRERIRESVPPLTVENPRANVPLPSLERIKPSVPPPSSGGGIIRSRYR